MPTLGEVAIAKKPPKKRKEPEKLATPAALTDSAEHDAGSPTDIVDFPESPASVLSAIDPERSGTTKKALSGRSVTSCVWNYFDHNTLNNTSRCLVPGCSFSMAGKNSRNTGNLVAHLRSNHEKGYEEYKEAEAERKELKTASGLVQSELSFAPKNYSPYLQADLRYRAILREISLLIAESSCPYRLVEHYRFRRLTRLLDPKCPEFGRGVLVKEINAIRDKLHEIVSKILDRCGLISLSADIWTKKGMTESFIGLICHCVDAETGETHHFMLACRSFPSPHTAENVYSLVQEILKVWGLPRERIIAIVTDNGSNMVCAFKHFIAATVCIRDEEADPLTCSDDNGSYLLNTSDPLEGNCAIDEEVLQFVEFEERASALFADYKRMGCFIHTLQLVVREFEKAESVKEVMKKVRQMVTAFNQSVPATTELIRLANKKLISDNSTRWNSTLIMVKRLLQIKEHVQLVILKQPKIPSLSPSDWKILEGIQILLERFELVTEKMSAEKVATLHLVIPFLKELDFHLSIQEGLDSAMDLESYGLERNQPILAHIVVKMRQELTRRFKHILDPTDSCYDPLYIAATFLHGFFKNYLTESEVQTAGGEILRVFLLRNSGCTKNTCATREDASTSTQQTAPLPKKSKSDGYELAYLNTLTKRQSASASGDTKSPGEKLLDEVSLYYNGNVSDVMQQSDDPRIFWRSRSASFGLLSLVALDIFAIGSGTADVERLFSATGQATVGRRNRLGGDNLETKVFIQKNVAYLPLDYG